MADAYPTLDRRYSAFSAGFGMAATLVFAVKVNTALALVVGLPCITINAAIAFPEAITTLRLHALHMATRILRRARR